MLAAYLEAVPEPNSTARLLQRFQAFWDRFFVQGRKGKRMTSHCLMLGSQLTPVHVSRERFCQLLVSRHNLVRHDDRANGIRGLLDTGTGNWFLISESSLCVHDEAEQAVVEAG